MELIILMDFLIRNSKASAPKKNITSNPRKAVAY